MEDSFRVTLVGPVGSGKTHFAELLYLTFADLSSKRRVDGVLNVPITDNTMERVDELVNKSIGPARTLVTKEVAETQLKIRLKGFWGAARSVRVSIADLSGETLKIFMTGFFGREYFDDEQKKAFLGRQALSQEDFDAVTTGILNSSGFILCANLAYLEDASTMPADAPAPDPALATFLAALSKYKELHPESPKPKAIAVILTHYDDGTKSSLEAKNLTFDSRGQGKNLLRFLERRMVSTHGQLMHMKTDWKVDVQYFWSGCEPELDFRTHAPMFDSQMPDRQLFKINPASGRPYYPVEEYMAIARWLSRNLARWTRHKGDHSGG